MKRERCRVVKRERCVAKRVGKVGDRGGCSMGIEERRVKDSNKERVVEWEGVDEEGRDTNQKNRIKIIGLGSNRDYVRGGIETIGEVRWGIEERGDRKV